MAKNDRIRFDDLEDDQPEKKKKKFNLFDFIYSRRNDLPDNDGEWHERTLKYFFPFCWHNFNRIFIVNLLFVFGNFSIFIIMLALSQNLHVHATAPASPEFAPIYGAMQLGALTPASAALYGVYGVTVNVNLWTPLAAGVLIAGIVILLITFGPVMVGTTYIHRNIVKGEPVFIWQDFWYAIRRNLRQEFIMGVLDLAFVVLVLYNIFFYYLNASLSVSGVFIVISVSLLVIYFIMRFYIYLMLITFKLSIPKILKNAFIFAILGIKRNLLALLGIILVVFLNLVIAILYIPLGVILPFMITVSLCSFIATYAAWPKIKQIMIDPYVQDQSQNDENESSKSDSDIAKGEEEPDTQTKSDTKPKAKIKVKKNRK